MSQTDLGISINVSYQQVQKYERGIDRLSALRLAKIAEVLRIGLDELLGTSAAVNSTNKRLSSDIAIIVECSAALSSARHRSVIQFAQQLADE